MRSVAVAWAAAHPETVRRLVLYGGWASGADISPPDVRDHVLGLVESHWGLGSDVLTDIFAPDATPRRPRRVRPLPAGVARAPDTARSLLALSYDLDVSDLLAAGAGPDAGGAPRRRTAPLPSQQAEALADGIADAQLVVLPGRSHLPYAGDAHERGRADPPVPRACAACRATLER